TGSAAATVAGAPPAEHEVSGARFARAALPCHPEPHAPAQGLAVFVGRLNRHPIGSRLEIAGQARGPDVRRVIGPGPGLLGRLVAGEHFLNERVGPRLAGHVDRRAVADDHLDRRTQEPGLAESRSASLPIPWKRLRIESRIWRPFGSF